MQSLPNQGTKEWIEWRQKRIGASDLPIIMNESKNMSEYDLYLNKMGLFEVEENIHMKMGKKREEEVRRILGIEALPTPFIHPEYDWAIASLDGIKDGVIQEIKCPGFLDHAIALLGKIPVQYFSQLQWQMFVKCVDRCRYVSYNPFHEKPFAYVLVHRNEAHIEKMLIKAKEFYRRMCEMDPPPPKKEFRVDSEWDKEEEVYTEKKLLLEEIENQLEESKKRLISMSGGKSCHGSRLSLIKPVQKGRIDYSIIPEIKDIDLEKYRGKESERWTISMKK